MILSENPRIKNMENIGYKKVDLFGNETLTFCERKRKKQTSLLEYDAFLEKFETKKTTDDCYTPKEVYKAILDYVHANYSLDGKEIIRPFFPDGDYESIDYLENYVVIDNPPFSIISKIARYYIQMGIPFFLFAPHLTLFGSDIDCTHIVVGGDIRYENGAVVKTSFLSNMFGDAKVIGDAELYNTLKQLEQKNKANLPKYEYPDNVLTVSQVTWMVERGVSINLTKKHVKHCRGLESQKPYKKAIFGSGFLLSDKAAQETRAAETRAAETRAAETRAAETRAAETRAAENIIVWELSPKEKEIISLLG